MVDEICPTSPYSDKTSPYSDKSGIYTGKTGIYSEPQFCPTGDILLKEDGFALLQETGDFILLEQQ